MATNSVGDFIKDSFAGLVNKKGNIFQALFTTENPGNGVVEKMFNDFEESRKGWCEASVYKQTGEQLEKTLSLFSVLEQLREEPEAAFIERNKLLFKRDSSSVWGEKWDILNIFKTFLKNEDVFLVNNHESFIQNILKDGNFEERNAWSLNGCEYSVSAKFEETTGILFDSTGECSQTVTIEAEKTYFLHFFLKGNIKVSITDNNGRFWNPEKGEFGEWEAVEFEKVFSSENWDNKSIFFISDELTSSVSIQFSYNEGQAFLDYVRLFEKTRDINFSLIAVFEGAITDKTVVLAPGIDDPIANVDYSQMSYFENAFVFGPAGQEVRRVYQELLDIISPGGVSAGIEILVREKEE